MNSPTGWTHDEAATASGVRLVAALGYPRRGTPSTMTGKGAAPGLGEGYEADAGDGRHGISGIRWGEEWSAGYERRPARWGQRWSWQNRGGYVDEMYEATSADVDRTEINR